VAGARAEPQRQVPAEVGADAGQGEPGRGQRPAGAGPAAGPGGQRAEEQGGRPALADRVHQADPLLILVQRRPVGQAGGSRGHGRPDPGRDQDGRRALGAAEQVEQDRGGPAAERQPDQRGVRGLAERHAVQRVGPRAGRQRAHDAIGQPPHHRIERVGLLEPLGHGGGRAGPAGLGLLVCPAGTGEGKPHI
jgi:hypothetical protein